MDKSKKIETKISNISDLGAIIRQYRNAQNLSQETAAGLLGVSRKLLSEIETGKKNTIQVGKILKIVQRMGLEIKLVPKVRR